MKNSVIYVLFFVISLTDVLYAAAFDEFKPIIDFFKDTITGPTVYYEYYNLDPIYYTLEKKGIGPSTSDHHEGTVNSQDNKSMFESTSNVLVGTSYGNFKISQISLSANLLFGIFSQEITYNSKVDNGYGGAYGFTSDFCTSIKYRTNFLVDVRAMLIDDIFIIKYMFISLSFKHISYDIDVSERRWYYNALNEQESIARTRTAEIINKQTSGTIGLIEPGFGFSINGEGRSKILTGFKWSPSFLNNGNSYSIFVSATLDFKNLITNNENVKNNN